MTNPGPDGHLSGGSLHSHYVGGVIAHLLVRRGGPPGLGRLLAEGLRRQVVVRVGGRARRRHAQRGVLCGLQVGATCHGLQVGLGHGGVLTRELGPVLRYLGLTTEGAEGERRAEGGGEVQGAKFVVQVLGRRGWRA